MTELEYARGGFAWSPHRYCNMPTNVLRSPPSTGSDTFA
jgi:hypothetical protein